MDARSDGVGIGTLVSPSMLRAQKDHLNKADQTIVGGAPVLKALAELDAVVNAQSGALDQLQGRLELVLRYQEPGEPEAALVHESSGPAGPLDDHLQGIARGASRNLQAIHRLMDRLTV